MQHIEYAEPEQEDLPGILGGNLYMCRFRDSFVRLQQWASVRGSALRHVSGL